MSKYFSTLKASPPPKGSDGFAERQWSYHGAAGRAGERFWVCAYVYNQFNGQLEPRIGSAWKTAKPRDDECHSKSVAPNGVIFAASLVRDRREGWEPFFKK